MRWTVTITCVAVLAGMLSGLASAAPQGPKQRYIVRVNNAADYDAMRARAQQLGGKVLLDIRGVNAFVISAVGSVRDALSTDSRARGVALDHMVSLAQVDRQAPNLTAPGLLSAKHIAATRPAGVLGSGFNPDPALDYAGLAWDFDRINAQEAWDVNAGTDAVTVGVADTGIDYTHKDLASSVTEVVDFTLTDDPPLCKSLFGASDKDFADRWGGPVDGDFHGHGSWIGGNIVGALNGRGINGIAPKVNLVSLKISQWCGSAYDSTLVKAFDWAGDHDVDVVSISFGGYLDRSDPSQEVIFQLYVDVVAKARSQGTVIVASAGNEHAEIGDEGLVLSHGTLVSPIAEQFDAFGLYEGPGGVPGVVDVSATGNRVNYSSSRCRPGTIGSDADPSATCKPSSDAHQANGQGTRDQLAYYSNYGSRIDVAAPGGARKFNLPLWDRGGTPGFPVTDADLTNVWEDFSTTSNFATGIPCYTFAPGSGFFPDQCYSTIQGTSMATPHVSAVLALIASAHPELQGDVDALIAFMESGVRAATNHTPVLSASDTSPGDLGGIYGVPCTLGYCHLGGAVISNSDAYGAGIVMADVIVP